MRQLPEDRLNALAQVLHPWRRGTLGGEEGNVEVNCQRDVNGIVRSRSDIESNAQYFLERRFCRLHRCVQVQRPDVLGEIDVEGSGANMRAQNICKLPIVQSRNDELNLLLDHSGLPRSR